MLQSEEYWEHFTHIADIGVRGFGKTPAAAFVQIAHALTAVITVNTTHTHPTHTFSVTCSAPDYEVLLVDWLNEIVYLMATEQMVFTEFRVTITDHQLQGSLRGEKIIPEHHHPATEIKGATYTAVQVQQQTDGLWVAQCVVDV